MPQENLDQRVMSIIAEQLSVNARQVTAEKDIRTDLQADSLDQIEILMAIEAEFAIALPDADVEQVRTVADAISLVRQAVTQTV